MHLILSRLRNGCETVTSCRYRPLQAPPPTARLVLLAALSYDAAYSRRAAQGVSQPHGQPLEQRSAANRQPQGG